jgi:EAL domain-containing protein (putative c-di-GMP-specific phosphodiesterase class I)
VVSLKWRTRMFVVVASLAALLTVALIAVVVVRSFSGFATRNAQERGHLGADLLATVGSKLPDLDPLLLQRGLSAADDKALDQAVLRGRREGLLSSLVVWDEHGRAVYSSQRIVRHGPVEPEVRDALAGVTDVIRHSREVDLSTGRRTGVLDAFEPLRDGRRRLYGALEVSLPLRPVSADADHASHRILVLIFASALALWLLALPVTVRTARMTAAAWVPGRRRTLCALRRGLAQGEIELAFQPQQALSTGRIHGVEALVRWRRSGMLAAPDTFLPLAEGTPVMGMLTDRVLDLALEQLAVWRREGRSLRMSVNLSAGDLSDHGLAERVSAALQRHAVGGSELTLEVTETAILEDTVLARRTLEAIRSRGVEIAVDDFGTGHASIARLHDLPISEMKIDRSFVGRPDEHSRAYLAAMIRFGQQLSLRVVVEGVEDAETLAWIEEVGCDLGQGYVISRPLAAAAMTAWLDDHATARVDSSERCRVSSA